MNNLAREFLRATNITNATVMTDDFQAILRKLSELEAIGHAD
jgi:hypothetical protein